MGIEEKESIINIVNKIHPMFIENEWKYGSIQKGTVPDKDELYKQIEYLLSELRSQMKYYGSDLDGFANVETGRIMVTWSQDLGFDVYLNMGEI